MRLFGKKKTSIINCIYCYYNDDYVYVFMQLLESSLEKPKF